MTTPEPPRDAEPPWYPSGEYAGYGIPAPADPIVPDPAVGFASWWDRCVGVARRSWRSLLVILAITVLVPSAAISVVRAFTQVTSEEAGRRTGFDSPLIGVSLVGLILLLVLAVVTGYLGALGVAASLWTATREAAGQPAPLAEALRYGVRRALPLWGWTLLAGLCIAIGVLCCVLPGIYLAVALSLIGPVVVFERYDAFSRSFRLIHSNFWPAAGRILCALGMYLVYTLVLACPFGILTTLVGATAPAFVRIPVVSVAELVRGVLTLPAYAVLLIASLVTYAELRYRETPVSTPALAAAMTEHP